MQTLQRRQLNDEAYDMLLENIKGGVWKNGDKLPSEYELCQMLQVSRSTVRIALQRLKALGLIEVKHGKGSFVTNPKAAFQLNDTEFKLELTPREFEDITVLREAIEPKAVDLAARFAQEEDLAPIRQAYFNMVTAAKAGDADAFSREDCVFHLSLLLASQNSFFIQIASIFKNEYLHYFKELNKFLFQDTGHGLVAVFDLEAAEDPHTQLYHYLCDRDGQKAKESIQEILNANRQRFLSNIDKFK